MTSNKNYIKLSKDRNSEYPIVRWWYTQHSGKTIEEVIDICPSFMQWSIGAFQNVTPSQAQYFKKITGKDIPEEAIQDVTPYEYQEGDPEQLYIDLCKTQDLDKTLQKYRGVQLNLF